MYGTNATRAGPTRTSTAPPYSSQGPACTMRSRSDYRGGIGSHRVNNGHIASRRCHPLPQGTKQGAVPSRGSARATSAQTPPRTWRGRRAAVRMAAGEGAADRGRARAPPPPRSVGWTCLSTTSRGASSAVAAAGGHAPAGIAPPLPPPRLPGPSSLRGPHTTAFGC
jgi:hypothetical protein